MGVCYIKLWGCGGVLHKAMGLWGCSVQDISALQRCTVQDYYCDEGVGWWVKFLEKVFM